MIHDFAVTKNYVGVHLSFLVQWNLPFSKTHKLTQVIFPLIPQTCSLERMKAGGEHWQWDPTIPCYFGVLPRHGPKSGDVKVSLTIV
jgi:carotenoid cleavage dioxygenase-like enzyme